MMEIEFENHMMRAFHIGCPKSKYGGIMKWGPKSDFITIEDGSELNMIECLHCGQKCYAGIDKKHIIRRQEYNK